MIHQEDSFKTSDGLNLYSQSWRPDGPCRAVMLISHGIYEHSGRHARLAAELVDHGVAVYAYDLRGHGQSPGDRIFVDRFEQFTDDLDRYLKIVAEREPGKPVFLMGYSMGGEITAYYAMTQSPKVRGVVLFSPALSVGGKVFPVLRHLARFASWAFPNLRIFRLGSRFVSRDPEVVAAFRADPLVYHDAFPVRIGGEILRVAKWIQENMEAFRLPVLLLHGTGDVVTCPQASLAMYERAASDDKTLKLYPGLYHELFSEPEREQVIGDLLAWLEKRID